MGRIPDEVVEQIREGLPIETLIGEYIPLRKAGTTFKALCPFHEEKTPSFTVNPRMGIFKCFGCGVGGDAVRFLMLHEGLNFREALQNLARRQGIDLSRYDGPGGEAGEASPRERMLAIHRFAAAFYRNCLKASAGQRARAYLAQRALGREAEEAFKVGYAPARWDALCRAAGEKGISPEELAEAGLATRREEGAGFYDRFRDRVMFPILGMEGEVIGFGGRSLPDSESRHATAKYINSPDTALFRKGRVLFGFHQAREAIRGGGRALVTEGYFDVISLWQGGFRAAVAPLGTALTAEQLRLLRAQAEEVVFVFDPDSAGRAASERAGEMAGRLMRLAGAPDQLVAGEVLRKSFIDREGLGSVRLKVVNLPGGEDVDDLLRNQGPEAFARLLDGAKGLLEHTVQASLEGVGPNSDMATKIAAVQRLIPILSACDLTIRNQYCSLLEHQLHVPYQNVQDMVQRMLDEEGRGKRTGAGRGEPLLGRAVARPRVEVDVLRILLHRPELAGDSELSPAQFHDPAVREAVGLMVSAARAGAPLRPASLAGRLVDPDARALVEELAAEDGAPEDPEGEFRDHMDRLGERSRRRLEERLNQAIEDARRREGEDSPAVLRLLEEKNALLRQRQRHATPR
ncbi:MAG: DNA primase [Candidatus Tectomicrobia bacterium]|uniref:DNA primase n=1 Tax=Tectimicrobiota bacterium TaxID=2528274 RepID=A0A932HYN8_UNCTE|nr:DNA primase [Candidatus Tectomicrobia bacterium]